MAGVFNFTNGNEDISKIEENLWLGNSFAAGDIKDLKAKGITAILSVVNGSSKHYFYKEHGFYHKVIDILDNDSENIIQYFGECINFIRNNDKVLVHCGIGASRSTTIVIAYLMWKYLMNFNDTLKFVKEKRPIASPNPGFQAQLKIFEKLLIETNYDIDKINFKNIKWNPPISTNKYFSYY